MRLKKYVILLITIVSYGPVFPQIDTTWVRRHEGGAPSALVVDDSGYVYVAGSSGTIKYSSTGEIIWVGQYGGIDMVVNDSGNVYVASTYWCGYPDTCGTATEFEIIKYALNGDILWVRHFDGPGNYVDEPIALEIDKTGNTYITGYTLASGSTGDYMTIKYAPNGETLWVRLYNGPGDSWDEAKAIAVDKKENCYVTGTSGSDFATIKYDSLGDTVWVRRFHGPSSNSYDRPYDLGVDDSGNVYVTGYSSGIDYATVKYNSNGDTVWARYYNGPGDGLDVPTALAVGEDGNVYVTGWSFGGLTSFDYATLKYTSNGDLAWVRRYTSIGQERDRAYALTIDKNNSVYVTGVTDVSFYCCGSGDFATIKYSRNGDSLWFTRYNGPGNGTDDSKAVKVDENGNVYVAGNSSGSYATIKYSQCFKPGDADGDGGFSFLDMVFTVNYVWRGGLRPFPLCAGDYNGDGKVNILDVLHMANYIFKDGPGPVKSGICCLD